jgi:hypothetical protein
VSRSPQQPSATSRRTLRPRNESAVSGSSFGGPGGDIAGSRRYVEELDTAAYGDRIEQWFDEAAGDLTEEAVVSGCLGVPARRLKRRERV